MSDPRAPAIAAALQSVLNVVDLHKNSEDPATQAFLEAVKAQFQAALAKAKEQS